MSNYIPLITKETYSKKEYLIYKGTDYRIWNNGVAERRYIDRWDDTETVNWSLEHRQKFINIWATAGVGKHYSVRESIDKPYILADDYDEKGVFLGFKYTTIAHVVLDNTSQCKGDTKSYDGLYVCELCKEIVGIEYEHKGR